MSTDNEELRRTIEHTMECAVIEHREATDRISKLIVALSDARRDQTRAADTVIVCRGRLSQKYVC